MNLILANNSHLHILLALVRKYHEFESINASDVVRKQGIMPLLTENSDIGQVWLIEVQHEIVGYIALCFGHSIELGGRDAFIDEFFMTIDARGKGIGSLVVNQIKKKAITYGVKVLHLEVGRCNEVAQAIYQKNGFLMRERYSLMSCEL